MHLLLSTIALLGAMLGGSAPAQPAPAHAAPAAAAPAAAPAAAVCEDAWFEPKGEDAQDCRDAGWTIRWRLVVDPHGVVRMNYLPQCRNEDGSGTASACSWNMDVRIGNKVYPQIDGNGIGLAFWNDEHDRSHYVWDGNPLHRNGTLSDPDWGNGPRRTGHPTAPHRYTWHWSNRTDQRAVDLTADCIVRDDTSLDNNLIAWCPSD